MTKSGKRASLKLGLAFFLKETILQSGENFSPDFVTLKIVIFYLLDTKYFVSLRHPN